MWLKRGVGTIFNLFHLAFLIVNGHDIDRANARARVCVCKRERGANKLCSAGQMRQTSRCMVSFHHSGTKYMAVKSNGRGCSPQNAGQTLHESDS